MTAGRKKVKWPEMTISNGVRGGEGRRSRKQPKLLEIITHYWFAAFSRKSIAWLPDSYFIQGLIPNKLWTHTHTYTHTELCVENEKLHEKNQKWKKKDLKKQKPTHSQKRSMFGKKKKQPPPSLFLMLKSNRYIYIYIHKNKNKKQKTKIIKKNNTLFNKRWKKHKKR